MENDRRDSVWRSALAHSGIFAHLLSDQLPPDAARLANGRNGGRSDRLPSKPRLRFHMKCAHRRTRIRRNRRPAVPKRDSVQSKCAGPRPGLWVEKPVGLAPGDPGRVSPPGAVPGFPAQSDPPSPECSSIFWPRKSRVRRAMASAGSTEDSTRCLTTMASISSLKAPRHGRRNLPSPCKWWSVPTGPISIKRLTVSLRQRARGEFSDELSSARSNAIRTGVSKCPDQAV